MTTSTNPEPGSGHRPDGALRDARQINDPDPDGYLDRLLDYSPQCLSTYEWQLVRTPAVDAIVLLRRRSVRSALDELRLLCGFLALSPDWDHRTTPDLNLLINERTIAEHDTRLADAGQSALARIRSHRLLRCVARVLSGGAAPVRSEHSRRGTALLLHPDQLDDLARNAWMSDGRPTPAALTSAVQLGAGVPARPAQSLRPEDIDVEGGAVVCQAGRVGVLIDVVAWLGAARAFLQAGELGPLAAEGRLADGVARSTWLYAHLRAGTPLAVINKSSLVTTGAGLQRHELERLLAYLDRPLRPGWPGTDRRDAPGTLTADSLAAVRALKKTLTVSGPEGPIMTATTHTGKKQAKTAGRKRSRASALRAAREAYAEAQLSLDPLSLDRDLPEVPGWDDLEGTIRDHIANYRPLKVDRESWDRVDAVVRRILVRRLAELTQQGKYPTIRKVNVIGSHLAPYAVWMERHCDHDGLLALASEILAVVNLDRYSSEAMVDSPSSTVATRRSEIRGALAAARPGPRPPKLPYRPVLPPYTAAEIACHVRLVHNQPTTARRRGLAFIIGTGYGAGLDPRDMKTIRASDIYCRVLPDGSTAVLIRVGGDRPRLVVVRDEFADLVLYAVQLHHEERRGRNGLILGRDPKRRNVTTPLLAHLTTADGRHIQIEVPRLRSTWLVAHMNAPVPLGVLLEAAGLRSVRALVDLLPYTTTPDEDATVELQRGRPGLLRISNAPTAQRESA